MFLPLPFPFLVTFPQQSISTLYELNMLHTKLYPSTIQTDLYPTILSWNSSIPRGIGTRSSHFLKFGAKKCRQFKNKIKISGKWFQFWVAGWEEPADESVELTTQNLSGVKQTDTRSRTSHTCNCTQVCSLFLFHSLYSFIYPSRSISLTFESELF